MPRAWLDQSENDVATSRHLMKEDHQDKQSDVDAWLAIHVSSGCLLLFRLCMMNCAQENQNQATMTINSSAIIPLSSSVDAWPAVKGVI